MQLGQVASPLEWERWPEAKALLDAALRQGDETWASVEAELSAGTMQLVAIVDGPRLIAAGVIRSALTPRGEMLEIVLAAGPDMATWASFGLGALRQGARDAGMTGVRLAGRPGWARIFREAGMKTRYVLMEMAA